MRFHRLGLSVAAALALGLAPARSGAQIVEYDPCFYLREDCYRRLDASRIARERALDRAMEADARARRLADERWERDFERSVRADESRLRAALSREAQERTRERQAFLREQQRERERELRERTLERSQALREQALERSRVQREQAQERAQQQREDAERRRALQPMKSIRYRWP